MGKNGRLVEVNCVHTWSPVKKLVFLRVQVFKVLRVTLCISEKYFSYIMEDMLGKNTRDKEIG